MTKREGHTTQWPKEKDIQHNDQKRRTYNTMTKREGHTTQWPKEKNIQHNDQKRRTYNTMTKREGHTTQWPKEKNIQHNDQKRWTKGTNNDLQNITHENKDQVTRTPLKPGGELRCSVRVSSSCSTSGTELAIQNGLSRDTGNDWAQGTEQRQTNKKTTQN
jgi:hypothetical protein